jgi:hypothetical protein
MSGSEGGRAEKDQPNGWHLAARSTLLELLSKNSGDDSKQTR